MNFRRSLAGLVAGFVLVASGCSGSRPTMAAPKATTKAAASSTLAPTTTLGPGVSLVATATIPKVNVYLIPDAKTQPGHVLANPNENGAPLVFLVQERKADWVHVYLPVRPNGANGWVRAQDVTIQENPYHIIVSASQHLLTLKKNDVVQQTFKVGIGRDQYPTPGGIYYIKELLQPPNPAGDYGPYAYGLSGFTEVAALANFAGGQGVIGIHGTNDPASVGSNVSHGCIRMYNADITTLSKILPLGTPVTIEA